MTRKHTESKKVSPHSYSFSARLRSTDSRTMSLSTSRTTKTTTNRSTAKTRTSLLMTMKSMRSNRGLRSGRRRNTDAEMMRSKTNSMKMTLRSSRRTTASSEGSRRTRSTQMRTRRSKSKLSPRPKGLSTRGTRLLLLTTRSSSRKLPCS